MGKIKDFFNKIKNQIKYNTFLDFKKIVRNKLVEKILAIITIIVLALIFSRLFTYNTLKNNSKLKNEISAQLIADENLNLENQKLKTLLESSYKIAELNNKLYNECADLYNNKTNSSFLKKSELPVLNVTD